MTEKHLADCNVPTRQGPKPVGEVLLDILFRLEALEAAVIDLQIKQPYYKPRDGA